MWEITIKLGGNRSIITGYYCNNNKKEKKNYIDFSELKYHYSDIVNSDFQPLSLSINWLS